MHKKYFEGWYYKQQKGDVTIAVIAGRSSEEAFLQVITNDRSYYVPYPLEQYEKSDTLRVGNSMFDKDGIALDIHTKTLSLTGHILFTNGMRLITDIMGPFRFLPMQCRHSVISMHHDLCGQLLYNGQAINFSGGHGYIEGDRGNSFPKSYLWLHCNDFEDGSAIMVSVASIPLLGFTFTGCICAILYKGKEYRLATYHKVRVVAATKTNVELIQGKFHLVIVMEPKEGYQLAAPCYGEMNCMIREAPDCKVHISFYDDGVRLFENASDHASFEYVEALGEGMKQ